MLDLSTFYVRRVLSCMLYFFFALIIISDVSAKPKETQDFWFGSYGRVGLSADESGGEGRNRQITPYGPRLIEDNYLELDLGYHAYQGKHGRVDIVTTISAFDQFFHYNGTADAQLAIRRAYAEVQEIGGTQLWASLGSRWLRGNDIYLMNFWPLDDLNTFGLTLGHRGKQHEIWIHAGVSRLNNVSQTQYVDVPSASNFGAESVFYDIPEFEYKICIL